MVRSDTDSHSTSELLADLATRARPLTPAWSSLGVRAFIDTSAALIAGTAEPSVRIMSEFLGEESGPVRTIADGAFRSARSVALLDGTAAHVLDYDDMDDAVISHPSAAVIPALTAVGQQVEASGQQLLSAYRVGVEAARVVAGRIGITAHFQAGWHSTATVGTISATAAICRLLNLPHATTKMALGLSGSLATGTRQNFGTMTKSMHAGLAASNGVTAARLAAGGFTADPEQLDGRMGFLAMHSGDPAIASPSPQIIDDDTDPLGINIKRYPCCYYMQGTIEAASALRTELGGAEIERIHVAVQPGAMAPLIHHRPADGMQAKFSIEYAATIGLLDDEVSVASFEDERVRRSDVQNLLPRVQYAETTEPPVGPAEWEESFSIVTVHTRDGRTYSARVDKPVGHSTRPLTEKQLRTKFEDCVGIGSESAAAWDALVQLPKATSTTPLIEALVGAREASAADLQPASDL